MGMGKGMATKHTGQEATGPSRPIGPLVLPRSEVIMAHPPTLTNAKDA